MKLHNYFRSSSSFRVRIALNLKGLDYDYVPVHIARGEHRTGPYSAISADMLVPLLEDEGERFSQSLAIMEYLDETHPEPPLLPSDPVGRAHVRALAQSIACEIHPLNNLRVLNYLTGPLALSQEQKNAWYQHWTHLGLAALEAELASSAHTGMFCHGDTPTLADCCLVPQVYNALRFKCDLAPYPTILRIVAHCEALPAFQQAHPDVQPDAE